MARLSSFLQGMGERSSNEDPSPPAETSEWIEQPQANPFAPSAPLPVGPQPTSHPYSPPEREMGPPSNPEYNPLAGLLDPNLPAYAQPGAQPARQPGDASYLSEMFAGNNSNDDDLPPAGSQAEAELMQEGFGNDPYPPGEDFRRHLNQADPQPGYMENVQAITEGIRNDPNFSPAPPPSDFGGGEFEEEEDEGGGSWWDWAPGDFDLDSVPQRALNVISGAGNVDDTIQNAVDPRVMPVPESEERNYLEGASNEMEEWAQEQVDTAQWIASDPIGAGQYLGNPTNWPHMAGAAIRNYRDNPEDAVWDFGLGAVASAGTGAATAGAGGLIYRGLNRVGAPDVPPAAVSSAVNAIPDVPDHVPTPSSVIRTASGVPVDQAAPSPSPGVARLMDEATSPAPAAPDVLGPQYQLPDVAPAVRNAGAPEVSGPQYQFPDAPSVRNVPEAGAPDMSGPQYQLPDVPVRAAAGAPDLSGPRYQMPDAPVARAIPEGAPDMSGPRYQLPDAPAVRTPDVDVPGRSLSEMDAQARAAAPDVDIADNAPLSALERLDARWNRNIERRQQRRSARQPTNIARRIVGRDQVFKPYTLGQRTSTRIGDWVGGGPGAEGSPNLLRQYVRSRLNKTDTMPEFPEGTNRALTGYERTQWRNQQLMRQPNRVRRAANAVGNTVENVQDAAEFLRNPWGDVDMDEPVGGSIYGDEEAVTASPRTWRRPTNPRFAAAQTPASQAYGQSPYVAGRGHRSE